MAHMTTSGVSNAAASKDAVQAIETDREFKAHIYQQLVDLQPYLSPESQVAVLVQLEQDEDATEADDVEYVLTLVATLGEYKLEAEGRDEDLYEALGMAKRQMLHQLDEIYAAAIDTNERDAQIRSLMQGTGTVH